MPWCHRAVVLLCHGVTVPRFHRAMVPPRWGTAVPRCPCPWCHHRAVVSLCLDSTVPRCHRAVMPPCPPPLPPPSLRDADLRLPLRPRGPGRAGADVPQGPVRGQRAGVSPSPRGEEAPDAAAGAADQEAGRARLPLHLRGGAPSSSSRPPMGGEIRVVLLPSSSGCWCAGLFGVLHAGAASQGDSGWPKGCWGEDVVVSAQRRGETEAGAAPLPGGAGGPWPGGGTAPGGSPPSEAEPRVAPNPPGSPLPRPCQRRGSELFLPATL